MAIGRIANPELTKEQVESVLVQPLTQKNTFLAAGPRLFESDGSQIRVPKLIGTTESGWHGENEPITEADVDWDSVILLPSTLKSVKVLVPMSNEIIRQSVIALEAALRDRLVFDVSKILDHAFFTGTGAADANGLTTPTGLLNWAGTQKIAINGPPTVDHLHDAVGAALGAYSEPSQWFCTPRDLTYVRKLKDNYGRYLLEPDPKQESGYQLLGKPVAVTNHLFLGGTANPTGPASIVLTDMSQNAVGRDLSPSVRLLDQTRGDRDQTLIRVVARYDCAPLNPEATVILTGVDPNPPPAAARMAGGEEVSADGEALTEENAGDTDAGRRTVKRSKKK